MQLAPIMPTQKPESRQVRFFLTFSFAIYQCFSISGLDGKVDRDADGKEVRYPVILSNYEKRIARKIVLAFRVVFAYFH